MYTPYLVLITIFARNVTSNRRRRRLRRPPAAARPLARSPAIVPSIAAALVNINSYFIRGLRLAARYKYTQTSVRKRQNVLASHSRQMGTKDLELG